MDFVRSILPGNVQGDHWPVGLAQVLLVVFRRIWLFWPFARHLWQHRVPIVCQNHSPGIFSYVIFAKGSPFSIRSSFAHKALVGFVDSWNYVGWDLLTAGLATCGKLENSSW